MIEGTGAPPRHIPLPAKWTRDGNSSGRMARFRKSSWQVAGGHCQITKMSPRRSLHLQSTILYDLESDDMLLSFSRGTSDRHVPDFIPSHFSGQICEN